ncbi:uncharacterized protein SETTUDRAFT_159634 [Exserohilum turcica Et28A]|uniref:GST C-terminal domain-containing protein n=1 Tax=Exserohilum turcicum (strain 28A) TaxID=671987 RepID=R0IWV0_EXST2|nr:uncharacterized protein SETTUDRAFT_159634 [Exserohilum turcica Et28A]EOA89230.1 hypothetical protein SETTUDRAFT_159634 [Exserohilum turcica Et28A]
MTSPFQNTIPSDRLPAEKGRYVLYINYVCPWAHRVILVRALKRLEDAIELVERIHGWYFSGRSGPAKDPVYGARFLKELYLRADPYYKGRVTVPLLWDKHHGTTVNNESAAITRMLFEAFDALLPPDHREANKGIAAFRPAHIAAEMDALNAWVYDTVNNGVYKVGFATSLQAYREHVNQLFQSLDRLEDHLSQPKHSPYLFGQYITESDIYLFTTLIRFDTAYYPFFKCNLKMIRRDYPRLHAWLRRLYWSNGPETCGGVFRTSTNFDAITRGYGAVVGKGPMPPHIVPPIMPW